MKYTVTFAALVGFSVPGSAADIAWLDSLGGSNYGSHSWANGVNADGLVVVGGAYTGNGTIHAFRWTLADDTMHDLGTLGGTYSGASAVNGDGAIVVGYAFIDNDHEHAFRWTLADNTMHDLGTLGGNNSWANGVSNDGTVVVGWAEIIADSFVGHAFRWSVNDNTMHDLGTLGGSYSEAYDMNEDGSVVVGSAYTEHDASYHAFRWTLADNTMHDLGTLGGTYSQANGANADGSVVVGWARTGNDEVHAFSWTLSEGTMHDLGTLGGTYSGASAVSDDGNVVVGWSTRADELSNHAFRWTPTTGMQSVDDWIVANGGNPLAAGNYLDAAYDVSNDGQVIVGYGYLNGVTQAFIARLSGVLGVTDFHDSLRQPTVAGAILHERMWAALTTDLQNNAPAHGQFAFSSQGIYDRYSKNLAMGDGLSGVFKLIYGITDSWRFGVGYSRAGERLEMSDNGTMDNDVDIFGGLLSYGDHGGEGFRSRLAFAYGTGDADLTRHYQIGSGSDQSTGTLDVDQYGITAEIGYGFRIAPQTLITPTVSYAWISSDLGAYSETGGTYPSQFDNRSLKDSSLRGGVQVKQSLSSVLDLMIDAQYGVRLSSTNNPVSGSLLGLGTSGAFSEDVALSKDWGQFRTGLDYVPESISKNLHLTLGGQVSLGQNFDIPSYRVDTGFVLYF